MNQSPWEPTRQRVCCCQRRGTTLVEVMAAGAMSVLLLGSLTLAMRAMRKQESAILSIDQGFEPWKQQLRSTIEWDLVNSRTWNHRSSSLRMVGFTGRDSFGRASLSKNMVEYRLMQIDGVAWLVRDSRPLGQADAKAERTLLCRGISKILVGRPEDDLRSLLAPRGEFDTFFPIPPRLRCVLVDAKDEPVLSFLILQSGGGA